MALQRSGTTYRHPSDQDRRQKAASRRKYFLRNFTKRVLLDGPADSRATHVAGASPLASRPVLVPLQFNLRRLPSRAQLMAPLRTRHAAIKEPVAVEAGSKRKRHASANDNSIQPRGLRAPGRFKRQRSQNESYDEVIYSQSSMDIDPSDVDSKDWSSDLSDAEEASLDDSDEFLLHTADSRQLNRLRKDDLIRLYHLVGHDCSTDEVTKAELVDAIISARIDDEEVPPSSPPGRTDAGSSDDDGNDGGGEETDVFMGPSKSPLRRRMTVQDFGRASQRTAMSRSLSLNGNNVPCKNLEFQKKSARIAADVKSPSHNEARSSLRNHRSQSGLSSPANPSMSYSLPSPPTTRLRSRTISTESKDDSSQASSSRRQISVGTKSSKRTSRMRRHASLNGCSDSIELDGVEQEPSISNPSPRRLRSKGSAHDIWLGADGLSKKRVTPMRKAKGRIGSLKEDSTATESDETEETDKEVSDEEIDELDSSSSPSQTAETRQSRLKIQNTPIKRRLRSRTLQTHTPPSDGDDECDDEDADGDTEGDPEEEEADEVGSETTESVDGEEDEESNETVTEPRVLRNGKVVGEDIEEDEDEENVVEEEEEEEEALASDIDAEEDAELESAESAEEDADLADEDHDEEMEDEFDLSNATQKTLVRLRRDDLVKLCEARELDVDGTKPQLASALLQWRNSQETLASSPSSTATARPRSVTKVNGRRRRTRSKSKSASVTPPVLLRSHRIHEDEPVTPPLSEPTSRDKKDEADLELDLESLGLEDREIPPDKLTKLEKIGSGGFKDVFIGKFRGRKVAIAEFRDQLSPMDIKELKLLAEFQHPNIVRFLGVSIPENTRETPVMIVSELCTNGDLFDYVRNVQPPSLYKVLSMMLDVARGLQYLHERKPSVIHRDCKSSNILITSKGLAKIADFGLAKVKQSTRSMVKSLVGTVNWQAPELWVAHPKYNHKVDVFSAACVYWEMLQWHAKEIKYPWEGMNEHAIYEAVGHKRQRPSLSGLRKLWCPEIVNLIEHMWAQDPIDRPTIAEVVDEIQDIIKQYR